MTPAERLLWQRLQRRAAMVTPELALAMLAAWAVLRDEMDPGQLEQLIALGYADRIFDRVLTQAVLDVAFQPLRERLRRSIAQSIVYVAREVPAPPAAAGRTLAISFDILNPRVIDAVRALETRVVTTLENDVRAVVVQAVERGIQAGQAPRAVARELREVIGLAPNQLQEVENFRAALEGKDGRNPFDYTKRDKRFDATIRKGELTPEQIEKMVTRYRERRVALNAESNARTAALNSYKLGQRLSWQDAVEKGIVNGDRLRHRWTGVADGRERPEHVAMNNESQPWKTPYSNGQLVPGETDYNCRCNDFFYLGDA